jgi:DNA-binding beta-propeller fold protein YncE
VINTATGTVTTTIPVGNNPIGVATARVPVVATASCPTGHVITGGGYQQSGGAVPPTAITSRPVGNTWQVLADNQSTNYTTITPYAVCAP